MHLRTLILWIAVIAASSCGSDRPEVRPEVRFVQQALIEKFSGTVVGVTLTNGSHLNVNFVNSPLKELPTEEKEAKAKEIAKLAFQNYVERDKIKSVRVAFVVLSTFVVVVTTNDSSDAFTFDVEELGVDQSL